MNIWNHWRLLLLPMCWFTVRCSHRATSEGALPSSCITTQQQWSALLPTRILQKPQRCNFLLMLRRSVEWTKGVDCLNVAAKELRNNYDIKSWLQIVLKQINSSRRCWSSDEGAVVRFLCIGKYKLWEKLWRSLYKSTVNNSLPLSITKIELHSVNFQRIRNDFMKYYFHFRNDDGKSSWLASDI